MFLSSTMSFPATIIGDSTMWILGLSFLELAFIAVFFIALTIGTGFDRRGREEPKWCILGVGFVAAAVYFWPEYSFFGPADIAAVVDGGKITTPAIHRTVLWDVIRNWSFWTPLWMFIVAGLVYSLVEFALEVRRMARAYAERWTKAIDRKIEVYDLNDDGSYKTYPEPAAGLKKVKTGYISDMIDVATVLANVDGKKGYHEAGKNFVQSFISANDRPEYSFIGLTVNEAETAPEPKIHKKTLAESIGAWTFMWPAYLVSLVLGDLLTEVFNTLADFLVSISGRFVKLSFSNVFKF